MTLEEQFTKETGKCAWIKSIEFANVRDEPEFVGWLKERCMRRCDECKFWMECTSTIKHDAQCPRWEAK